jgi:hypothetical protein
MGMCFGWIYWLGEFNTNSLRVCLERTGVEILNLTIDFQNLAKLSMKRGFIEIVILSLRKNYL